jgi:hypothetical protein
MSQSRLWVSEPIAVPWLALLQRAKKMSVRALWALNGRLPPSRSAGWHSLDAGLSLSDPTFEGVPMFIHAKKLSMTAIFTVLTFLFSSLGLAPSYGSVLLEPIPGDLVATSSQYDVLAPDVAISASGNSLVVWNQEELAGVDPSSDPISIAFSVFDAEGVLMSGPTELAQVGNGDYYYRVQQVAYNSTDNEFLVVWSDYVDNFMQRVSSTGDLLGSQVVLSSSVTSPGDRSTELFQVTNSGPLQVAWDASREQYFITTWDNTIRTFGELTGRSVVGNFYSSDLSPVDGFDALFEISDPAYPATTARGYGMSIAQSGTGVWAISYNSDVDRLSTHRTSKIVRLLDRSDGAITGMETVVALGASSTEVPSDVFNGFPQVVWVDSKNAFLVTWNALYSTDVVSDATPDLWQTYGRYIGITDPTPGETVRLSYIPSQYTSVSNVIDEPYMYNVRPEYDVADDRLIFTGHAEHKIASGDSVLRTYFWTMNPDTNEVSGATPLYQVPSGSTLAGQSARPAVDSAYGLTAIVYMNWPNGDYATPAEVRLVITGSAPAQAQPPAPYSGALPAQYSDRTPSIGDEVTISGADLDQVTSCTIDGAEVEISSQSATGLTIVIPVGLEPGLKDLVMVGAFGKLTAQGAFTVEVGSTKSPVVAEKTNAGSFNGYVAVYAKGHKGKTLSWKIAGKWFKTTITSDFQVFQRKTEAIGLDVQVHLYIDGEKQSTMTVRTS